MSTNATNLSFLMGQEGLDAARVLYLFREEKRLLSIEEIAKWRSSLPVLLNFYSYELASMNAGIFPFLTPQQKADYEKQLILTYYLLYAQYQLNLIEKKRYSLVSLEEQMTTCSKLIETLASTQLEPSPQTLLEDELKETSKPLKYLGLTTLAPFILKKVKNFIDGKISEFKDYKTGTLVNYMGQTNEVRLYWVWTSTLLTTCLSMMPTSFFNTQKASQMVTVPSPFFGYMSWMLYYLRFGVQLGLLLKHTIKGPWMDAEEAKIPTWERFKTQWDIRKFSLLNDFIWGIANFICFFWLVGQGLLGYAGNLVTTGLLLMDLSINIWRFWEADTDHDKNIEEMVDIQQEIQTLIRVESALSDDEQDRQKIADLKAKFAENNKLIQKIQFEWKYKKLTYINDVAYAAGLLMAFAVLCCFFLPPIPIFFTVTSTMPLLILSLVGAALCFVATLAYAAISGTIEIAQSQASYQLAKQECNQLITTFNSTADENLKKQLFLQMRGSFVETDYQKRLIRFQSIKLVRSIFIDAFVPIIIFTALVFMPLGIGLGVLAAGLALAILSKILINQFEPHPEQLPSFSDKVGLEFKEFNANPTINYFETKLKKDRTHFFANLPLDNRSCRGEEKSNDNLDDFYEGHSLT